MVPDVYVTTRRYEFQSLYYAIIFIFLSSKQQSTQFLRFQFHLLNTDKIFITAAVFDTDVISFLYGNGSALDELQTTLTGLSI